MPTNVVEQGHLPKKFSNQALQFCFNLALWMLFAGANAEISLVQAQNSLENQNPSLPNANNSQPEIPKPGVQLLPNVQVTGGSNNEPRNSVSLDTGGSLYHFGAEEMNQLPKGHATPLNEVLLQAPGVVNDALGQIHVRGEHANVQYQLNGVLLPQGLYGFGQSLDTRFAKSIDLIEGALPAQFGLHTAGVVDITSLKKSSDAGSVGVTLGSSRAANTSIQFGGSKEDWSYYVSGSYLTNHLGIENPSSSVTPIHDVTHQGKGFLYLSYELEGQGRLSLTSIAYNGSFQIPNLSGQVPAPANPYYALATASANNPYSPTIQGMSLPRELNSALINDQQLETSRFSALTYKVNANDDLNYQVSVFQNQSATHYVADMANNLIFNGVGADIRKTSLVRGLQADINLALNDDHALKFGWLMSLENVSTLNQSLVYGLDAISGNVQGPPYLLNDNTARRGLQAMGIYVQDHWSVSDRLSANVGLRYDAFRAFFSDHQFSPRFGVIYQAPDHLTLHGGFAHYFTPPPNEWVSSSTQSVFAGTSSAIPGLNSDVKAEIADYYDIGFLKEVSPAYSWGLDAYYKSTRNTLDEGQFGPALILTPYNYEKGRIVGLEWSQNLKLGAFTGYMNMSLNLSQAKNIVSGQYLFDQATLQYAQNNWINVDHAQSRTLSMGGAYRLGETHLHGNVLMGTGLRSGFANTEVLPAFSVLNLGASRTLHTQELGEMELRVSLNNVLDRVYAIRDGSGIGVFAAQYGARRGLQLTATKKF
jgi:outer membrane receptor protein involved in Fe transport